VFKSIFNEVGGNERRDQGLVVKGIAFVHAYAEAKIEQRPELDLVELNKIADKGQLFLNGDVLHVAFVQDIIEHASQLFHGLVRAVSVSLDGVEGVFEQMRVEAELGIFQLQSVDLVDELSVFLLQQLVALLQLLLGFAQAEEDARKNKQEEEDENVIKWLHLKFKVKRNQVSRHKNQDLFVQ